MSNTSKRPCDNEVTEILSFLSAKCIMRFRSLSRNVLSCSADDHFLLTQSHRTRADCGFFCRSYGLRLGFSLLDPHAGIPIESLRFLRQYKRIVLASGDGLVVCSDETRSLSSLCVCNPAHRNAAPRFIPPPQPQPTEEDDPYLSGVAVAVAVDPMSRGYKLVCLTRTPDWYSSYRCWVYGSADNAWKRGRLCDGGPRNLEGENPVICGRTLYVASDYGMGLTYPYIVAFDIEEGGSEILCAPGELPKGSVWDPIRIARWGEDSVCLIYCEGLSKFKLWAMSRDEEGTTTWAEIYQVSVMEMGLTLTVPPARVHSFTLINSDTLVFGTSRSIYRPFENDLVIVDRINGYSISKEALEFEKRSAVANPVFIPYANTLRPC